MAIYEIRFIGYDEKQRTIQEVLVDGEVKTTCGYGEAVDYVKSVIARGDIYTESEFGDVYCEKGYDGIMAIWAKEDRIIASWAGGDQVAANL